MSGVAIISLLPIIIIVILGLFIRIGLKKAVKHITWNRWVNKGIIVTYLAVLFCAVIIYEFIPSKNVEQVTAKELEVLEQENEAFEEGFLNGNIGGLDSKFLVDEWSKELNGDTIDIVSSGTDFIYARVIVEWTDSQDQIVEGKVYRTNMYDYEVNLNKKIPLSKVFWEGDHLTIEEPPEQKFDFYRFSDELAFLSLSEDWHNSTHVRGGTYIVLKVPKHMSIVDEMGFQVY